MKFISKAREAILVIRPAQTQIVNGFKVPIKGQRVYFHNSLFDTDDPRALRETFPEMEPGEETEKKAWLENWLVNHPSYGKTFFSVEDKEVAKEASKPASPYACPFCDFEGKNDNSLRAHMRAKHKDKVSPEPDLDGIHERSGYALGQSQIAI